MLGPHISCRVALSRAWRHRRVVPDSHSEQFAFQPPCRVMYRVFLGAPPPSAVVSTESYHWQTVSTTDNQHRHPRPTPLSASSSNEQESYLWPMRSVSAARLLQRADSFLYPPATLEAASRRISLIYKNAIFDRTEEGYGEGPDNEEEQDEERGSESFEPLHLLRLTLVAYRHDYGHYLASDQS